MLRCIIVDDDLISRRTLENLCNRHGQLHLEGIFTNAQDALDFLAEVNVPIDLVFLDVEMPGMSGLEFLDNSPASTMVIFTTSNPDYAVNAFEYNATDFLVKPIKMPRFEQAVNKANDSVKREAGQKPGNIWQSEEIYVKEDGSYVRVPCDEVLYFETVGDYVKMKTAAKQHLIHGSLKSVDEKLNDPRFLKVHRSFIVNLNKIKRIDENSLQIETVHIPISRANRPELMRRLRFL